MWVKKKLSVFASDSHIEGNMGAGWGTLVIGTLNMTQPHTIRIAYWAENVALFVIF